jgi:hypothetical protein
MENIGEACNEGVKSFARSFFGRINIYRFGSASTPKKMRARPAIVAASSVAVEGNAEKGNQSMTALLEENAFVQGLLDNYFSGIREGTDFSAKSVACFRRTKAYS